MVEITARYEGNLRCSLTHGPSGATLRTDAPKDNQGEGAAFSPTDLVAAALPACMMTIMGIVARRHGLDLTGMTAVATKEMVTTPTRRIGRVVTRIRVPLSATHPQRASLENAAHTCPVHRSLLAEIDAPIEFEWMG